MSKNFRLSGVIPEPLTFTDDGLGGDGHTYDVKTAVMLSAADMAALDRIYADVTAYQVAPGADAAAGLAAARLMEQRLDEYIQLLIPDLPPARLQAIPIGLKLQLVSWWRQEHPETAVGEAARATARRATQARRSPASAMSTADGPATT
jgi:hypothetical protein